MKLKKLLAGITAAALAVSAMAFSNLTASAADSGIVIGTMLFAQGDEAGAWQWITEVPIDSGTHQGSYTYEWAKIGDAGKGGVIEEGINEEGLQISMKGHTYADKAVEIEITEFKIGDTDRLETIDTNQKTYFSIKTDSDQEAGEVFAKFPLGIKDADIGQEMNISFKITFDPASSDEVAEHTVQFPDGTIALSMEIGDNGKIIQASNMLNGLTASGISFDTTTYKEIKNSKLVLEGYKFEKCSLEGVTASDVIIHVRAIYMDKGTEKETAFWDQNMGMSNIEGLFSNMYGAASVSNDAILTDISCEVCIADGKFDIQSMPKDTVIMINRNENAKTHTIPFSTDKIKLTVGVPKWEGAESEEFDKYASIWQEVDVAELKLGETTYESVMNDDFYIKGINYVSCSLEEVNPSDIDVTLFVKFGDKTKFENAEEDKDAIFFKKAGNMTYSQVGGPLSSFEIQDASGFGTDTKPDGNDVIIEIGYEIFIPGNPYDMDNIDEVIINVAEEQKEPEETIYTYEGQTEPKPIEEGNTWCQIAVSFDDLFGDLDQTKLVSITFSGENLNKVGYSSIKEGQWHEESATNGEVTLTKEDLADINGTSIQVAGNDCTLVKWVAKATAKKSSGGSADTPSTTPDENDTPVAPKVSSNKHQGIGMPPVIINQKSAPAASAGEAAASGSTSVTLGDSTTVSKDVIDSVSGKDSVEFKLANGASWEIEGVDLSKAEGMDLGIVLDTKTATAAQLEEVAKDNDTFQFSLNYSGDFGFSAVVNIPVDAKYNGKYANLYWFNNGKFDFVGSSKVEGGIADFTMKHASDYVIVFDDEAYGEDVSSGAGIYEEESETSAPAAVVVTFAALAVSAVILKKRVF